jgi:hypothetical protein
MTTDSIDRLLFGVSVYAAIVRLPEIEFHTSEQELLP